MDTAAHTDLALQLVRLQGAVESMQQQQQAGAQQTQAVMQTIQADLRKMADRLETVPVMNEQIRSNADRAESLTQRLAQLESHTDNRFATQRTGIETATAAASRIVWLGTGVTACAALIIGLLTYMYNTDKQGSADSRRVLSERINENFNIQTGRVTAGDQRIDRIELYLAGDRSERFKR